MRKIVYIALTDTSLMSDGVCKKVKLQTLALSRKGLETYLITYCGESIVLNKVNNGLFEVVDKRICMKHTRRLHFWNFVSRCVKKYKFDIIYLRYPYCTYKLLRVLRLANRFGGKNIIEIPSYPICWYNDRDNTLDRYLMYIRRKVDEFTSNYLKKYVSEFYVIGESVDSIKDIQVKIIPNGTDIGAIQIRKPKCSSQKSLHILFLASFYFYQGADRIIEGLHNYYNSEEYDMEVFLEIAGDGPELEKYRKLVLDYKLENYVNFHGFVSGDKVDELFDLCNIACSCLASHRGNIEFASPLKSKEYFAKGIPYIYSYKEIGLDDDYPYAYFIESNEEPIDIDKIIAFYQRYKDNLEDVAIDMRDYALQNFSWDAILEDIS